MLNLKTLKQLQTEANKNYRSARALFRKHDNGEDMHDMDRWLGVKQWLDAKIKAARIPFVPSDADELRELRERKGWRQADAAAHFGVDRRTIIRAEAHEGPFTPRMRKAFGGVS